MNANCNHCGSPAEEIERLRKALREIAAEVKDAHDGGCIWPVKKILAPILGGPSVGWIEDWQKP